MTFSYFIPWEGELYRTAGLGNGVKLLLVGDSHYGAGEKPDFTQKIVNECAIDQPIPFFEKLRMIASGTAEPLCASQFWGRVSFCNFVQECLPQTNSIPTDQQLRRGWAALQETIISLAPEMMFVFSRRAWEYCETTLNDGDNSVSRAVRPDVPDCGDMVDLNFPR